MQIMMTKKLRAIFDALNRALSWPLFDRMGSRGRLVAGEARSVRGRAFVTTGTGNVVEIGKGARFQGRIKFMGDDNKVLIGKNCFFNGRITLRGSGQTVVFGDQSAAQGVYILCAENCDVHIGKWCMFSREIEIRTSDGHSVIDRETGERVNSAASIEIGDHVWVGMRAIVNKGTVVPSDTIVAAMSFVNGRFEEQGVILAGGPARVVKRGVTWSSVRKPAFDRREMDRWKR
jgi:acetyltransferase-like isoleucine patch superfamily enzyme